MKKYNILVIVFLIISINTYSQNIKYGISGGVNYSYVYNSEINRKQEIYPSPGFIILNTNEVTYDNYWNFTENIKYTPTGKIGFLIDATAIFPINKHFSLKTGLGINMNNINFQKESYITGEMATVIIDNYTSDTTLIISDLDDLVESAQHPDYNKVETWSLESNMFFLKIPLQLQVNVFKNKLFITSGLSIFKQIGYMYSELLFEISPLYINELFVNLNFSVEYNLFKNVFAGYSFEPNFNNMTKPKTDYSYRYYIGLPLNNMSFYITYKF